ncbi:MAG: phage holin family protein [Bacteroidaceae bacterium]|nr:phage holin family protein [Bacteroidaceae bacterium]
MNLKRFLGSYGFGDMRCFCLSLFPSFKYGTQTASLTASAVLGAVSEFLGLTPALVVVMFVAVLVETLTGTRASLKRGEPFESWKFSRCVLKVMVWVFLLFMFHRFSRELCVRDGWVFVCGGVLFQVIQVMTMVYFCIEYATSIMENLAMLDGKPKTVYVERLKDVFVGFVGFVVKRLGGEV